ncbi:MAG TPA: DUF4157 domain-containing protein, partial [Jatrophihabitans sp.]|nr:DUF4157 domain-containing protein [Jatrophihabitans sp.]
MTRAPAELAQALRASHGVDVGDVPVHRDPAAGNEARERRARAFSRGGRVYLPEEAGPLHSAPARGLLAHELVHVAQQRRLGSSLPAEDTPEGRALEAEAQDAERMYATDAFAETALVHAPPPVSAGWVEERITQHALELPMPAQYPSITNSINPGLLDEVKYTAQKIVTDAVEDGSLSGSGGGSRSGSQDVPLGIGIGNAQNLAEFQAQTLAALNAQRREANEREYTSLADLTAEEQARIEARYKELYAQNRDAIVASQMEFAVQQLAAQQHENLSWTPQGGFQRGGAPQSTPPSGSGNTSGPPGTPPGTTPSTTTQSTTTPTGATPPATRPPTPPTPPLPPERIDEGYDIGIGHAHSEQEFREQILLAMNMHRAPDKQLTWSQLSESDRARVTARWQELTAAQEQQAEARRFQSALQRQAQRRAAQTAATRPEAATPAEAAAAGAVIGAQTADARTAAEHTNDLETDSGVTNTTAAGHPAISVDRIDMDDLTVRL